MFKKDFPEKSRTLLQKKESKKLKGAILSQFPNMSEAEVEVLLGGKSSNVTEIKLNNRILVYCIDNIPYFFESDSIVSSNPASSKIVTRMYPTIFALWKFPHVVTSFIIHAPVSSFVLKGADLMMPGLATISNLKNNLRVGDVVAIRAYGNPLPFAVGESLVSWEGIEVNGRRGRGVKVLHSYTDHLFLQAKQVVGNAGFGGAAVYPVEGFAENPTYSYYNINDDAADDEKSVEENDEEKGLENDDEGKKTSLGCEREEVLLQESHMLDLSQPPQAENTVDVMLQKGLLVAVKYIVKDKQLPVLASAFWAVIHKCISVLDDRANCDIKSSSYKKVGPFLQKMEKNGLLKLETLNGITSIVSVQRIHDLYRSASVADPEGFRRAVNTDEGAASNAADAGRLAKITVAELYKIPKHIVKILGSLKGQYGACLKASEVRDALVAYFKSKDLDDTGDKAFVNVLSSDLLYKVAKKCPTAKISAIQPANDDGIANTVDRVQKLDLANGKHDNDNDNNDNDDDDNDEGDYCDGDDSDYCKGDSADDTTDLSSVVSRDGVMVAGVWMPTVQKVISESTATRGQSASFGNAKNSSEWKPIDLARVVTLDNDREAAAIAAGKAPDNKVSKKKLARIEKLRLEEDLNNNVVYMATARKDELFKTLLRELSPYAVVVLPNGELSITAGDAPQIEIIVESRMGHKTVTRLRGLESFGIDLNGFTKECQKKFACSASVSVIAGMLKEKEVNIQGHLASETEGLLVDSVGVPRHCVNVTVQKNVKSKKK